MKTLYSVHGRDEVCVWELTTGKALRTIPAPKGCHGVAISPDGRRLIATGTGEVWAWDISAGVPQLLWKQKKRGLGDECVVFAPNSLLWLVAEIPPTRFTCSMPSRRRAVHFTRERHKTQAFSPNGRTSRVLGG